jgi:hypothetical protein
MTIKRLCGATKTRNRDDELRDLGSFAGMGEMFVT